MANATKVTTPRFRAAFAHVFEPQKPIDGSDGPGKYGVTMLFEPDADLEKLWDLARAVATERFGNSLKPSKDGNWFMGLRCPFRDGDEKADLLGFEGKTYANATSKYQPGLVSNKLRPITDPKEFASGDYARATVTAYAYDQQGNKGVAFGLQNIQRLEVSTERFSSVVAAEDDFDVTEGDDDFDDFDDEAAF